MADFKRARSEEQKSRRTEDIKNVVDSLFKTMPYHEITLTNIAEGVGLTRVRDISGTMR